MSTETKKINIDGIMSYLSNNIEFHDATDMINHLKREFSLEHALAMGIVHDWRNQFLTIPIVSEDEAIELIDDNIRKYKNSKPFLCPDCKTGELRIEVDSITFFKLTKLRDGAIIATFDDTSCMDKDRIVSCANVNCTYRSEDKNLINSIDFTY